MSPIAWKMWIFGKNNVNPFTFGTLLFLVGGLFEKITHSSSRSLNETLCSRWCLRLLWYSQSYESKTCSAPENKQDVTLTGTSWSSSSSPLYSWWCIGGDETKSIPTFHILRNKRTRVYLWSFQSWKSIRDMNKLKIRMFCLPVKMCSDQILCAKDGKCWPTYTLHLQESVGCGNPCHEAPGTQLVCWC